MTMNRLIPPIDNRHKDSLGCIVWTSTRNYMTARKWLPNRFVPFVPITMPVNVEVVEMSDCSDVTETSVDATLMEGIIENLHDSPNASFDEIPNIDYATRYVNRLYKLMKIFIPESLLLTLPF